MYPCVQDPEEKINLDLKYRQQCTCNGKMVKQKPTYSLGQLKMIIIIKASLLDIKTPSTVFFFLVFFTSKFFC